MCAEKPVLDVRRLRAVAEKLGESSIDVCITPFASARARPIGRVSRSALSLSSLPGAPSRPFAAFRSLHEARVIVSRSAILFEFLEEGLVVGAITPSRLPGAAAWIARPRDPPSGQGFAKNLQKHLDLHGA